MSDLKDTDLKNGPPNYNQQPKVQNFVGSIGGGYEDLSYQERKK